MEILGTLEAKIVQLISRTHKLAHENSELVRKSLCQPVQLINVHDIPDEELLQYKYAGLMEYFMKHVKARDFVVHLRKVLPMLKFLLNENEWRYLIRLLYYSLSSEQVNKTEVLKMIDSQIWIFRSAC